MIRKVLLCAATGVLAVGVACSKSSQNPTSPTAATQPDAGAAADGSTLKATTPTLVSPTGGEQVVDPLVLTAGKSAGKFTDVAMSYRFQVRSGSTVVYDSGITGGSGSGNNVTHTVPSSAALNPDADYTWRVRGESSGAFGSWSSDGTFRSPVGAYIRGNEIRDPLTIGRTVGTVAGPVQFTSKGIELLTQGSVVSYVLPTTLEAGEFSAMVTGIDEGSPGDKSKVLTMQEGTGDITTNRYRFTAEKRGRSYVNPGAVTFRIITGNPRHESGKVNDGARVVVPMNDESWYFWKLVWGNNRASLEVRADSPTGRRIYFSDVTMAGSAYRPNPHVIHLGQPSGRAGLDDASIPGAIYKNVWVGTGPRPTFPN